MMSGSSVFNSASTVVVFIVLQYPVYFFGSSFVLMPLLVAILPLRSGFHLWTRRFGRAALMLISYSRCRLPLRGPCPIFSYYCSSIMFPVYTKATVCRFKCVCQLFQVGILIWRFQCQHGESQGQLLGVGGGGGGGVQFEFKWMLVPLLLAIFSCDPDTLMCVCVC